MRCETMMKQTLCACSPETPLADCADLVLSMDLPMLAVVDRDVLIGVIGRNRILSTRRRSVTVGEVMTTQLVYCAPEDTLVSAARALARTGGPAVFVAADGELVGWLGTRELSSCASADSGSKAKAIQ